MKTIFRSIAVTALLASLGHAYCFKAYKYHEEIEKGYRTCFYKGMGHLFTREQPSTKMCPLNITICKE